jgi:ABC-type polysaccharide/polyol phosphate transport system ATPase subunit
MERIIFDGVWKKYDRVYGSNRFRGLAARLIGRDPTRNEFWALQDVSFRLEEGKSFGIIGPNGSGKTTVLRILSGITHINRGHVRVRGTVSALIALGAGFHPELTGRENVYLNGSILGLKRSEIREYFDDIVDFAGIGSYIDAPVKRYSSGMFVRLGFAVAAQVRPDVLLVDEVLAVGDARFQARCHGRIRELREEGTIIVLVSHDMWAIRRSCMEGVFLNHGKIQTQGDIATVISAYTQSIQEQSLRSLSESRKGEGKGLPVCSCDLEFRNAAGEPVSEIPLGDPVAVRLHYACQEPLRRPTLVLTATAHDGPAVIVLRSRKAEWNVDVLEGTGSVDVTIGALSLNPGRYAFALSVKDEHDFVSFAESPFRELFVRPPHPDWCEENCYYVPEAKWSEPHTLDPVSDGGAPVPPTPRSPAPPPA